jgi:hypothetical protein
MRSPSPRRPLHDLERPRDWSIPHGWSARPSGFAALGAIDAAHRHGGAPQGMLAGLRFAYFGGATGELSGALIAIIFTRANSIAGK